MQRNSSKPRRVWHAQGQAATSARAEAKPPSSKFCQVCGCHVTVSKPGAWDEHVKGIRHRRRHLGANCVSMFEDLSQPGPSTSSRDPVIQALHHEQAASSSSRSQGSTMTDTSDLQHALKLILPHLAGRSGSMLHRASAFFTQQLLEQGMQALPSKSVVQQSASPTSKERRLEGSPSELACFAWRCPSEAQLSHIRVAVPYLSGDSPEAVATFAALILLMDRLRRVTSLHTLSLFMVDRDRLFHHTIRQRGTASSPQYAALWSGLLKAIRDLVQACPYVRRVELATPPGLLLPEQILQMQAAFRDTASRDARRLAVLRCTHSKAGQACHLKQLPLPVLELILDQALPKQACVFNWEVQLWDLPGFGVSSSSSGSDDSSEADSDDGEQDEGSPPPIAPDVLAIAQWL